MTIGADEFALTLCTGAIGGTAAVTGASTFCGSGTPVITASGYSFGTGSTYQWQSSTNALFIFPFDIPGQIVPGTLSTGTVTSTTYYRLKVTCPTGVAEDFSNIIAITINSLPFPYAVTGGGSYCGGGGGGGGGGKGG